MLVGVFFAATVLSLVYWAAVWLGLAPLLSRRAAVRVPSPPSGLGPQAGQGRGRRRLREFRQLLPSRLSGL